MFARVWPESGLFPPKVTAIANPKTPAKWRSVPEGTFCTGGFVCTAKGLFRWGLRPSLPGLSQIVRRDEKKRLSGPSFASNAKGGIPCSSPVIARAGRLGMPTLSQTTRKDGPPTSAKSSTCASCKAHGIRRKGLSKRETVRVRISVGSAPRRHSFWRKLSKWKTVRRSAGPGGTTDNSPAFPTPGCLHRKGPVSRRDT